MAPSSGSITTLLRRWHEGDAGAWGQLTELVYPELHRLAVIHFRNERSAHLLQPTALIHEVWLRLIALNSIEMEDRLHFFSLCSRFMRRILVDHARRRDVQAKAAEFIAGVDGVATDPIELDLALDELNQVQPRPAKVVELRYYGGMSIEEVAEVLDVSPATVKRDWLTAKAWLYGRLMGNAK